MNVCTCGAFYLCPGCTEEYHSMLEEEVKYEEMNLFVIPEKKNISSGEDVILNPENCP